MKKFYARARHFIFKLLSWVLPIPEPEVISGPGSTTCCPEILKAAGINNVLVVTDSDIVKIGLIDDLLETLQESGITFTVYSDIQPNPTIQNVEKGLKAYLDKNCHGVVAFGGGSPIDCAKIIAARATNKKPVKKMKGLFKLWHRLPFLMAIPTTAGTGTEATIVAVITDPEEQEKFAINDMKICPKVCILDPELLRTLPPHLTSTTGMDALTHAIEAYIGLIGTAKTNRWAIETVRLTFQNLERSYHDGTDMRAREAMLMASHYGGKAFTRAYVGYVHAIAHNLGGVYGLPHGLANAIVLPYILEILKDACTPKLADLAIAAGLGNVSEEKLILAEKLINGIKTLNQNMNIPSNIMEIREEDIPMLAKRIEEEGNPAYPVPKLLWAEDFEKLLHKIKATK
ncbi:MAG: iron-containing alcohol dehydrogenase [Bacillota bacterium]